MRKIELLAPAKNLNCGIAAINHGADAVYIGADRFSARSAASNSLEDIAKLVKYAHLFNVKVYLAVNTILTDTQLNDAEQLIWDAYRIGVDAVIIQDMGILEMNLPPIVIHASTQTDNRTTQKVNFLRNAGCSRVVLARELSRKQIANIASKTSAELEVFVHGALCVSYSGRCYISEAMTGRSANRGECAQYCRLPYNLLDAEGKVLFRNRHFLSLKDLDLSDQLEGLMEAGVMSFKVEGRLKDVDYVKNIIAYYSQKLDEIILKSSNKYVRASSGTIKYFFTPNPEKSFRRSKTDYFINGRHKNIIQIETPKSTGEPLGKVISMGINYIEIDSLHSINNGDGLVFINQYKKLEGFRVNRVDGNKIYPHIMPNIQIDSYINRNYDRAFDQLLQTKTSERKIGISLRLEDTQDGISVTLTDKEGNQVVKQFLVDKELALQPEKAYQQIENQWRKTGNTIFEIEELDIAFEQAWFFPVSVLNEWRRVSLQNLQDKRLKNYQFEKPVEKTYPPFPTQNLDYKANVTNHLAEEFYRKCGVEEIAPGFEIKAEKGVPLMFSKHCIRYEMGWCDKYGGKSEYSDPLYLQYKKQKFELLFDCNKCEMHIKEV